MAAIRVGIGSRVYPPSEDFVFSLKRPRVAMHRRDSADAGGLFGMASPA